LQGGNLALWCLDHDLLLCEGPHSTRQCRQHKSSEEKKGRFMLGQRQLARLELLGDYRLRNSRRAASAA
jgi:hypothetical protein